MPFPKDEARSGAQAADPLFQPLSLGPGLTLPNRLVMAPMTRCMASPQLAATQAMAEYYAKRAAAGLIVSEATLIRADGQGYPRTPGIWSPQQIEAWQTVTERVHEQGGRIFCQLWHTGRAAHSAYHHQRTLAPSALGLEGTLPRRRRLRFETPHALTIEQIAELRGDYAQAADNAIVAGFDGVEIHGANGYLIEQFLREASNQRQDEYGGKPHERTRFAIEIVDAVAAAIGGERTALRLSPVAHVNIAGVRSDEETYDALLAQLNARRICYLSLGIFDDFADHPHFEQRASTYLRRRYRGRLMVGGSYDAGAARQALRSENADLVALGRLFIANPDLIARLERGIALDEYQESMLARLD